MATTSRQRLHGLKWPFTNPKLLSVDFLSPEEVKKISEGDLVVMTAPPAPEVSGKGGEEGEVGGGEEEEERGGGGGDVGETGEGVREEGEEEGEQEKPEKRRRESSGPEKVEEDRENEIKSKNGAYTLYARTYVHSIALCVDNKALIGFYTSIHMRVLE